MTESQEFRIGVVIVNFNSGDYLQKCVRSINASTAPLDIVIVDNDSLDDSLESIEQQIHQPHQLRIIENQENYGFSKAVNQGVVTLQNEYIMLLNPDCTVFPETLLRLQQVMASDPQCAVAGALVFNPDGSEQRGCRRNEPTLKRSMITALGLGNRYQGVDQTYQRFPSQPVEIDAVSGAAMLVRREYLGQVGGFDEDYFLHCEDLDICRRMRDSGYKVLFCPNASVIHRQGGSAGASSIFVERHKHRGMLTYNRKHYHGNLSRISQVSITVLVYVHFWISRCGDYLRNAANRFFSRKPVNQADVNEFSALDLTDNPHPLVVITGGKSDVGDYLIRHFSNHKFNCIAVSRNTPKVGVGNKNVHWLSLEYFIKSPECKFRGIDAWINLAPAWTTKTLAQAFHKFGPKQIIALSSTSIEGKADSEDDADIAVVNKLIEGERWLEEYTKTYDVGGSVLRPTLIYGGPRNQNINFIASVIRLFRVFIIVGTGSAKRQPVHSEDVAIACTQLLDQNDSTFRTYNIGGGEILSYREMVARVFKKLGKKERIISVSLELVKTVITLLNWIPGLRFLGPEMANRMELDLVYSNKVAEQEFSYRPRKFNP